MAEQLFELRIRRHLERNIRQLKLWTQPLADVSHLAADRDVYNRWVYCLDELGKAPR